MHLYFMTAEITKANGKCSFQSGSLPYCSPHIPEATQETHTAASPFHTVILDCSLDGKDTKWSKCP